MTRHISSEKARANWRDLLNTVAAGETVVIERYGEPIAKLSPVLSEAETKSIRETAPDYSAFKIEDFKQQVIAEVLAELTARRESPRSWREELAALQASIAAHGGLNVGDTTEEIVEHMRRTRQEVWDAEYAHLYR
jgi:antitoxin (DNA-binding transcriptional repressor) of toxin-antitoxin stability system